MGQKTHPKGFRLITNQKHLSQWYSSKENYSKLIEEDFFLRTKVTQVFEPFLTLSTIEITRTPQSDQKEEYVQLTLSALFPRAKEMTRKVATYFSTGEEASEIQSLLTSNGKDILKSFTTLLLKRTIRNTIRFFQCKTNKKYIINIRFIKNQFEDATLIAKFIAEQLEKRSPFRRVVKQTIKKVQRTTIQGIKVQVSGRLNGAEIARSEWKRNGRVPLHTLDASIDYISYSAQTIYGVIGIKVWLFHEMKQNK